MEQCKQCDANFVNVWSVYCQERCEIEALKSRIEELEAALRDIRNAAYPDVHVRADLRWLRATIKMKVGEMI